MYRLGLHLTLRSGREPFVRLLVTAVAVAIGVAIMLAVLADFHAFQTTNNRPSWESTQGQPVGPDYASASRSELWNYSNDIYQGQTIERLDVAGLGAGAPVPPGISRLPASGQYYASPALAALIRSVPADELADRFPGRLAGTIGQQALTGPTELVIYVGYAPAKLAGLPGDHPSSTGSPPRRGSRSGRATSATRSSSAPSRSCSRSSSWSVPPRASRPPGERSGTQRSGWSAPRWTRSASSPRSMPSSAPCSAPCSASGSSGCCSPPWPTPRSPARGTSPTRSRRPLAAIWWC